MSGYPAQILANPVQQSASENTGQVLSASMDVDVKGIQVIDSFKAIDPLLDGLDPAKVAFILDFDETTVITIMSDNGRQEYWLIGSPDYRRTYSFYFKNALEQMGRTMENLSDLRSGGKSVLGFERYEILDHQLKPILEKHKGQFGYLTILSGLKEERVKTTFLREKLDMTNYLSTYGTKDSKADVLAKNIPPDINTIIFVDNSPTVVKEFTSQIKGALEKNFTQEHKGEKLTVYTFHLKKFENMLTENNGEMLKGELTRLFREYGDVVNESDDDSEDD